MTEKHPTPARHALPRNAGKLHVTTPDDREIRMVRQFTAPRRLVFDAWTKPALLKRWMHGPDNWSFAVCEVDLRVGGRFRYVWRSPEGEEMGMSGEFREVVPPARLVSMEQFDEIWTGGDTLVTVEFAEADGHTTLTMTLRYPSQAARDEALQSPMEDGMAQAYDRLAALLPTLG